ncbi:hypothetical protein [Candidatus Epulonipiscium viviparus]|nr:hypothetical protein [Candidatus Epulopiscium viviparus]
MDARADKEKGDAPADNKEGDRSATADDETGDTIATADDEIVDEE